MPTSSWSPVCFAWTSLSRHPNNRKALFLCSFLAQRRRWAGAAGLCGRLFSGRRTWWLRGAKRLRKTHRLLSPKRRGGRDRREEHTRRTLSSRAGRCAASRGWVRQSSPLPLRRTPTPNKKSDSTTDQHLECPSKVTQRRNRRSQTAEALAGAYVVPRAPSRRGAAAISGVSVLPFPRLPTPRTPRVYADGSRKTQERKNKIPRVAPPSTGERAPGALPPLSWMFKIRLGLRGKPTHSPTNAKAFEIEATGLLLREALLVRLVAADNDAAVTAPGDADHRFAAVRTDRALFKTMQFFSRF